MARDFRNVTAERLLQGQGDLADGGLRPRRLDGKLQEIGPASRAFGERRQRGLRRLLVPLGAEALKLFDLPRAHRRGVDFQHADVSLDGRRVDVDADHGLAAGIDARLRTRRRLFNAALRHAALDRLRHPAEAFDLVDMALRPRGQFGGKALDIIGAAPGDR